MATKNVNGVEIEMTAEEVTAHEAAQASVRTEDEARLAVETQKETDKASAKAKLIAGEALTEAEADTVVL